MIELKLEIADVNNILGALGKFPFEQVADLIGKIRSQAMPQIPEESDSSESL